MFLDTEVRNDFFIDEKRKKIWKIELDILAQIQTICEKHDISYFAFAGTMLGAVRHGGFIPWDDDLDIGMLREEYERFLSAAKEELKEPYSLQLSSVEEGYFEAFARVRHSQSSAIIEKDRKSPCNNGIFVDIFPFDGLSESLRDRKKQFRQLKLLWVMMHDYIYKEKSLKHRLMHCIMKLYHKIVPFPKTEEKYKKCAIRYEGARRVGLLINEPYNEGFYWEREWLLDLVDQKYEYMTIKIPRKSEEILTQEFGDYKKFPPVEERGVRHSHVLFNPDTPYKELLKENKL